MKNFLFILCLIMINVMNPQAQEKQLIVEAAVSSAVTLPLMESEVFNLINQHRVAHSLPPLRWSSSPANQARQHSLNMANGVVPFGHQGADLRYAALKKLIPSLTRFGENVAYNYGFQNPAEKAVNGWLSSAGHYANIMGDYNLSGVGVARNAQGQYYFTQIFVKAALTQTSFENIESSSEKGAQVSDDPIQLESEP